MEMISLNKTAKRDCFCSCKEVWEWSWQFISTVEDDLWTFISTPPHMFMAWLLSIGRTLLLTFSLTTCSNKCNTWDLGFKMIDSAWDGVVGILLRGCFVALWVLNIGLYSLVYLQVRIVLLLLIFIRVCAVWEVILNGERGPERHFE
jgi:hypothetical protein